MKHTVRADGANEKSRGSNARLWRGQKRNGRMWWMLRYDMGSSRGLTVHLCSTELAAAEAEHMARDLFDIRGPITRVREPIHVEAG